MNGNKGSRGADRRRRMLVGSVTGGALAAAGLWRLLHGGDEAERLDDGRVLARGGATAFGTTVSIAAIHADASRARAAVAQALAETQRIDMLMSLHRPDSQVSRLNRDGVLEDPHPHVVRNLRFAQVLARQSDRAFDVTVQPLWEVYASCGAEQRLPEPVELATALARVDPEALEVGADRVRLHRGATITLNGIAQGYAADVATRILRDAGIADGLIDTGEFGAAGANPRHEPWTLGLRHPRDPGAMIAAIRMDGRFLATSGDYATTFSADYRHHHVVDPRTGVSPPDFSTVAVAAATGLVADGLATALMVLDAERGRQLLARYPRTDAVWVDKAMRVSATPGMPLV